MHGNTRISCRINACMVVALPLINHVHLGVQSQLTSYASKEGLLSTTWLPIFLSSHAHYSGCYIFTLPWCSSLTYGAATEPRTSCVLPPHDCATRCALVSWLVKVTSRQSVCRNLNNVLICLKFYFGSTKIKSTCLTFQ